MLNKFGHFRKQIHNVGEEALHLGLTFRAKVRNKRNKHSIIKIQRKDKHNGKRSDKILKPRRQNELQEWFTFPRKKT